MAKSQFTVRMKMFIVVLITVVALAALASMALYFYVGHGVTATGSTAEFAKKLVYGNSFTIDDVIKDQNYKYGWLKSKVDVEVYGKNSDGEYLQTNGIVRYDEASRTFSVVGTGSGKIVFTNPVDKSVSFEFPIETRFAVDDTETLLKQQYSAFYADGIITEAELDQVTALRFDQATQYDITDFGSCPNFERVIITVDAIMPLKGLSALSRATRFYVPVGKYNDYMAEEKIDSSVWNGLGERIFPTVSGDTDKANLVFEFNGGNMPGYDETVFNNYYAVEKGKPLDPGEYKVYRTGYTFVGWFESDNGGETLTNEATAATVIDADKKLYAKWAENSYKIVYVNDDVIKATNALPDAQNATYTQKIKLSEIVPEHAGYEFLYWSNDNQIFEPGQEVEKLIGENDVNFTLKAVWKTNKYTLVYDGNGVIEKVPERVENIDYEENIRISDVVLERTGYTFLGWGTSVSATKAAYHPSETVSRLTPAGTIVLYAVWQAKTYTVSFESNGGSACGDIKVTYDKSYSLPTASRSGYFFRGWFVSGSRVASSGVWRETKNIALEASWAKKSATYQNSGRINVGDTAPSKNGKDTINFKSLLGYSLADYRSYGATSITFGLTISMSTGGDNGTADIHFSRDGTVAASLWSDNNVGFSKKKTYTKSWSFSLNIASCNETMYISYGTDYHKTWYTLGIGKKIHDWARTSVTFEISVS